MDRARYQRAKALFEEACEREGEDRDTFLAEACADDPELLEEVRALLAVDAAGVPELESGALGALGTRARARPLGDDEWARLVAAARARDLRVVGELARGGMGAILRVEDPLLRRELAMKVALDEAETGVPPDLSRFLEEAQITAQLDHPGIVPVHEIGVDADGRLFFTLKLVRGQDLSRVLEHLREGREGWTLPRALGVLQRVCEAMAYAHDKGVVHRDLKPANVMVGDYGEVLVMDWGVARVLDGDDGVGDGVDDGVDAAPSAGASPTEAPAGDLSPVRTLRREGAGSDGDADTALGWATQVGSVIGSPYFMAPEQARGEPAGPAADVYAVGAMLYQLLSGRRPYEPARGQLSAGVVVTKVREGAPEPLARAARGAPPELVAICERAMARDPRDRYPTMGELGADLRAFLEGRVVRAFETGAWAELKKWVGRNRLAAAGALLAGVSVVGGVWWSQRAQAASLREIDLASDYYRVRVLLAGTDDLWPAVPARLPALEDWRARATRLVEREPEQAARLAALEVDPVADPLALERQRELLQGLDALTRDADDADDAPSLLARIDDRIESARTLEHRSRTGPEARAAWERARASIRSGETHGDYADLDVSPQLGLLPLGVDPDSGLWMFAHLESGEVAALDARGAPVIGPDTGLVLVLLPGGTFDMGSSTDPADGNFDPEATSLEYPVHEVTLAPFFLSKHEMTQEQWARHTGTNPSKWVRGETDGIGDAHPVEQVDWLTSTRVLGQLDLVLPTEAQWEYACRAGTGAPYHCDVAEFEAFANVCDLAYVDVFGELGSQYEELDDGFAFHAPVGSLRPNAFGLHDLHGNVFEWTRDVYGSYLHARDPVDGLTLGPGPGTEDAWWSDAYRVLRGGCFETPASFTKSARRVNGGTTMINHALGCRPARALRPAGD